MWTFQPVRFRARLSWPVTQLPLPPLSLSLIPIPDEAVWLTTNFFLWLSIDLMPDKRAGSWRGMWPGRDVAAHAKSVFSTQFSVTFTFLFSQHSRLLSSKKRELATRFSFLCMSTTVSGSNSWRFAIIGARDQSLEVWQRALRISDWRYRRRQIFQALLPFFFFACFLIFLKKAFSERKIALEIFPKKDEGTLQITAQSNDKRDFWDRWSSGEGNLRLFDHRLKKCLYLYFLALFYFLQALLMAKVAYHCLKKYQRVTSLSLRRILHHAELFFLSTLLGPQTCFLYVCELASIRLSDSKWGNSPPAKVKPVKD